MSLTPTPRPAATFGATSLGSSPLGGSGASSLFVPGPGTGEIYYLTETPAIGTPGLFVEVDFSQAVEGIGVGASSAVSLWDLGEWDTAEWEEGTVWTDVTSYCRVVDTNAEFSRELSGYNAGRLTVVLDNANGYFSPDNTDSPFRIGDSTAIGVLRPIRVRFNYNGTDFFLFTGRVETWDETPDGLEGASVTVTAIDPFAELAAFDSYAQSSAGAGEVYGDRINRILDNAGWTGDRFVDDGVHTMQATTLAQNALTELKLTADSEGGAVWCGPDGAFYADGQSALVEKARSSVVQVVFTNSDYSGGIVPLIGYEQDSVEIAYDGSQVVNLAAYARTGGTVQVASSTPSRVLYGDRQDQRSDLICETDGMALALAERKVALYQNPERRVEQLTFSPDLQPSPEQQAFAWQALTSGGLALRSLVQLNHTTSSGYDITKYLYIRGISHRITPQTWDVTLKFASASVLYSLVGSDWDLGLWDEAGWSF